MMSALGSICFEQTSDQCIVDKGCVAGGAKYVVVGSREQTGMQAIERTALRIVVTDNQGVHIQV